MYTRHATMIALMNMMTLMTNGCVMRGARATSSIASETARSDSRQGSLWLNL